MGMNAFARNQGLYTMPSVLRIGLFILPICLFMALVNAQNSRTNATSGEIDLHVNDPSGAALRASGLLIGPHANRSFQTDATGAVSLGGLAFGTYQIHI